jgi:hypothetical protein
MASDYDKAQHRAEFHARELAKAMDELIGDAPGWTSLSSNIGAVTPWSTNTVSTT